MSFPRGFLARLSAGVRKDRTGHFDEEIQQHAELLAAEYVRRGMSEAEAHLAARRELGNVTSLRQEYREQNSLPLLDALWQDLKFAVRTLRRNPVFTAAPRRRVVPPGYREGPAAAGARCGRARAPLRSG